MSESIVHTGQHFDANMSQVFFDQMSIPEPDHNLGIGGQSHGAMTGAMLAKLEALYVEMNPSAVLVYGDTNSTLAGALAASKLHIPVVHVEAGLRSYNKQMPEEQNRVLTDHLSRLLLVPTDQAVRNLEQEGLTSGIERVGDVMYDAALFYAPQSKAPTGSSLPERFGLMTLHRAENTDSPDRLNSIVDAVNGVPDQEIVLPLHPRTKAAMERARLSFKSHVWVIDPVGYLEMSYLEQRADFILTDSGGVQKEAYFFNKPCGTLRDETEWSETVTSGANTLLGAEQEQIVNFLRGRSAPTEWPSLYGDGDAGTKIVKSIAELIT
jgi:UDP-GlcNAc3NAcA epimerase